MNRKHHTGWACEEFAEVNLGDKRLDSRLMKLCDSFSEAPESSINQACEDWAETKAAYRFFQNNNVQIKKILTAHCKKTARRAMEHKTVLALQDTSYFIYTGHQKTKGLGQLSLNKGRNVEKIYSNGLMVHTCLAVTTDGLPLGLLDQKIISRKLHTNESHHSNLSIERKESYKWLESLEHSKAVSGDARIVTVCDREADLYDFFRYSQQLHAPVLVRASANRTINRSSRYAEKNVEKLWEYMYRQTESGFHTIEIPRKAKTKHCKERESRIATITVRFARFTFNPPRNNVRHGKDELPDIEMNAVYVCESSPPDGEEALEWMLLTNMPVTSYEEAIEKVLWYCKRWRIEMFFKVLKSGFRVEACRLAHADRLARYLTVMSIVAWRIFMITLIARTDPAIPCSVFLAEHEWKVLYLKTEKNKTIPEQPPPMGEVVIRVAKLGGYLARRNDGPPGTITLWRGWKRLMDLAEGLSLADPE